MELKHLLQFQSILDTQRHSIWVYTFIIAHFPQPRPLGPTDLVNWPWHSPLTHREGRHTLAIHMKRRHTETHKITTQETHRETLRNTKVCIGVAHSQKQRKTVNHSIFFFDLRRPTPVPFTHQFKRNSTWIWMDIFSYFFEIKRMDKILLIWWEWGTKLRYKSI